MLSYIRYILYWVVQIKSRWACRSCCYLSGMLIVGRYLGRRPGTSAVVSAGSSHWANSPGQSLCAALYSYWFSVAFVILEMTLSCKAFFKWDVHSIWAVYSVVICIFKTHLLLTIWNWFSVTWIWSGLVYSSVNGSHSPLSLMNGRTPSPASLVHTSMSQQLPPACGARQLSKLKRFLTTLQQFGSDISPDIGERVRTLVLGLVVCTMQWSSPSMPLVTHYEENNHIVERVSVTL